MPGRNITARWSLLISNPLNSFSAGAIDEERNFGETLSSESNGLGIVEVKCQPHNHSVHIVHVRHDLVEFVQTLAVSPSKIDIEDTIERLVIGYGGIRNEVGGLLNVIGRPDMLHDCPLEKGALRVMRGGVEIAVSSHCDTSHLEGLKN